MKKSLMVIILVLVTLLGINGCKSWLMRESPLDSELEKMKVPAVIAITPEGKFVVLSLDGKPLESCTVPKKGAPIPEDACPAFQKGAEVIFKEKVTIIKSKGSCWYTYFDSAGRAHKIKIQNCP
jgi:hypothetical protein